MRSSTARLALSIVLSGVFLLGCSGGGEEAEPDSAPTSTEVEETSDSGPSESGETAGAVPSLAALLPENTRGAFAIDVAALLSADSSGQVAAALNGEGEDPLFAEFLTGFGALSSSIDVEGTMGNAMLVHTTEPEQGAFLLARVDGETLDEIVLGSLPEAAGTYGSASHSLYVDAAGNQLVMLPGGVLVAGELASVQSVLDVADGSSPASASPIDPFLGPLLGAHDLTFAYGLPALFGDVEPDLTLESAAAVSGSFDLVDGSFDGEMSFHSSNATEFVDTYNALNNAALNSADPAEVPLTVADPVVGDLEQVVVKLAPRSLDASFDELVLSSNVFKKLFAGMGARDYVDDVADRTRPPWLDFRVRSERDGDPSPGSVYIRWEFKDQAAIQEFEQNELPEGFRIAPTRFLESDAPEGEYFFALNLYNAGGGSIVGGARAEWDVFVHGPDGADPNAGVRPRFMVVEALAEEVSADAGNLLTPAEPLSHDLVNGAVVSSVRRFDQGQEVEVFESSFPAPGPGDEVARFTREMAIGNDYIYWAHGVSDRVFYNATTFNHDAYFVDTGQLTYTDVSPWAKYLKPEVKDAVYYVNSLEYVASPMANLDSEYLDLTPEWLAKLVDFTTNGHQSGLMRTAVEQSFRGEGDPLVGRVVTNETPSTYYNFEISDPGALEEALDLPPGHSLAPTTLFEGAGEAHYLTLSVLEFDEASEGTRAEWSVYTDDGSGRPPGLLIIDLMTEDVAFDPASIINLPSDVRHVAESGVVRTRLTSSEISFEASFDVGGATSEELTMDWIEAGDSVCRSNGICDRFYYDAETLDVPVKLPVEVRVDAFSTPWDDYIEPVPTVFFRDNYQEYAVMPWFNLDVPVERLPFSGLDDATHAISGTGALDGRSTDLVDSAYSYTGDATIEGDQLRFAIDQQVDNALGVAHIFTTGSFDLASGTGTQTVVDCVGPALMCSDIRAGSASFYTAEGLDASNPDTISWQVNAVLALGGGFGTADSASTLTAVRN